MRYGGDEAFPPFESRDAQGRPQGFQIDLLDALGPVAGVQFDVTLRPWSATEQAFRAGQLDVIAMVDTQERRAWARFTRGHATPAMAVYHRRGMAPVQGLLGLKGLRLAAPDRLPMRDTLAALPDVQRTVQWVDDPAQALDAVRQGVADAALLPRAYADPLLARPENAGLTADHLNYGLQPYAFAVAPGREALQARLQRGLDELEASGRIESLRVKWLSSHRDLAERGALQRDVAQQRWWTWGVASTATGAVALLGTGLWQRGRRIAAERERRHALEAELRRAEALVDHAFTRQDDAMLLVELPGLELRDANPALQTLLGVDRAGLMGVTLKSLQRHLDTEALHRLGQVMKAEGAIDAAPVRLTRADGSVRDGLVSVEALRIDEVPHVFCIVRDVTEPLARDAAMRAAYDALAGQLEAQRRELEAAHAGRAEAEARLHEFTRVVAHDLKSPLNGVMGFARLLRARLQAGSLQQAQAYTEHIERAARRMTAMVNALQRLADIARQPLQRRLVDMQQLASGTIELLRAGQPDARCELRIEALPPTHADPDLVAQVWQNLLGNAMKFSALGANPKVSIDSYRDARGTWYRVTDNGAGFDMARAQSLFMPFQRMHTAQEFEGSGIGLSLVRRIVDHHGGEVRLRSAPGVGTVAEFTLDPLPA